MTGVRSWPGEMVRATVSDTFETVENLASAATAAAHRDASEPGPPCGAANLNEG